MATSIETGARSAPSWLLPENATMRLPPRRSATVVRAVMGSVLVTRAGDLEDHVLEPGDELVVPPGGLAVAWALTEAVVSLRDAAPPPRERGPRGGAGE